MQRQQQKITIYDVATQAGVSPSTVSLAFSGKRPLKNATRRRIAEIAETLGYRPNHAARSLAAKKSKSVGVLINHTVNVSTTAVIDYIDRALTSHGYHMLLMLTHGEQSRIKQVLDLLGDGRVDSVLNLEPTLSPQQLREHLPHLLSVTMQRSETQPAAEIDHEAGSIMAVEHLVELGHRRIGLVSGALEEKSGRARQAGYIRAMRRMGLEIDPSWLVSCDWSMEQAQAKSIPMLLSGVTAVYACNSMMAVGVMRACRSLGVDVPTQVSVIGFDDSILALILDPPLTTIDAQMQTVVEATVQALVDLMEQREPADPIRVMPKLILRQSTAPPPEDIP